MSTSQNLESPGRGASEHAYGGGYHGYINGGRGTSSLWATPFPDPDPGWRKGTEQRVSPFTVLLAVAVV